MSRLVTPTVARRPPAVTCEFRMRRIPFIGRAARGVAAMVTAPTTSAPAARSARDRLGERRAGRHDVVDARSTRAGRRHPAPRRLPATFSRRPSWSRPRWSAVRRVWTSSGVDPETRPRGDELGHPVAAPPERRARGRASARRRPPRDAPMPRPPRPAPAPARAARPVRPSSLSARRTRAATPSKRSPLHTARCLGRAVATSDCRCGSRTQRVRAQPRRARRRARRSPRTRPAAPARAPRRAPRERSTHDPGDDPRHERCRRARSREAGAPHRSEDRDRGAGRLGRSRQRCGVPCCVASTRMPAAVCCQFVPRRT